MKPATRVGLAVALTVFLVAAGTGVSYALWATTASTSADVKTGTVLLAAQANPADLELAYSPSTLTATAPVRISNAGSVDFEYFVMFTPSQEPSLSLSSISVEIWNSSDCSASAPAEWSGTLADLEDATEVSLGTLGALNSAELCVRTAMAQAPTQGQQGQKLEGNLVFTGKNGWMSEARVAIKQSVYTVPPPGVISCAKVGSNDKFVTLTWPAGDGGTTYDATLNPSAVDPEPTSLPTVTLSGDAFIFVKNSRTATVAVTSIVDGWSSAPSVFTVWFAKNSSLNNDKIYCANPDT